MAKVYRFYTDDYAVDVEYWTDGLANHETFHVTEVRGLDSLDVKLGIKFEELPYTETAFTDFAKAKGLSLAIYNDDTELSDTAGGFNILAYSFAEQTGAATIDKLVKTVDIEVANGTDVSELVATFTLSTDAAADISDTAQVSATTENDFTDPVVYTITSDLSVEQDWTVTVTVAAA